MDQSQSLSAYEKSVYLTSMKPALNKRALFSDLSEDYVIPLEPNAYGLVKIRFRTGKNNVDQVYFICKKERVFMNKILTKQNFDYYECEYQLDDEPIYYCFEVVAGKHSSYYDLQGSSKEKNEKYFFRIIPGFKTPDWAKSAVMYQIFVDRFYNGDPTNDVETNEYYYINGKSIQVTDWNKYPEANGIREFYGGDLQGVIDKLDYLSDLGIDAIYFNPLFVSPSNHKYDIQDYDYIDPHFGKIVDDRGDLLADDQRENRYATRYIDRVTNKKNLEASNELFIQLVEEAHKRGIKIILDGVFNHCGSFNKWMDRECIYENEEGYEKGAYISEDSPYRSFFDFREMRWPYNPAYDGWWGHDTLPKLNYENSYKLKQYILDIARKWVSPPYNVDGWRLDVAADLGHSPEYNHQFWKDFRRAVKESNPNAIIIAEHYGRPLEWLKGDEWDTIMNYDAFMEPVTWFLTGMQKHSDDYRADLLGNAQAFWSMMKQHYAEFSAPSMQVTMNELSNHDHSRFLTRTNHVVGRSNNLGPEAANHGISKAVFREAVLFQFTWAGAPTIYYGDEAGLCGFTDPDNRRTYPWGHEDHELINYHKDLIRIRKANRELGCGSMKPLLEEHNLIAYGRFNTETQSVIIINNDVNEREFEIKLWDIGVERECMLATIIMTTQEGYQLGGRQYEVTGGKLYIKIGGYTGMLLKPELQTEVKKNTCKYNEKSI
ncbi:MAG: glycoside hydrolase family 13 protein [Clostridia bacterium]|nr:glycoside hydrolase family 13 protein [Clostridia bacterium]